MNVEDLFEVIPNSLDRPADVFRIQYAVDGYPTSIGIDRSIGGADDELSYRDIVVIPK